VIDAGPEDPRHEHRQPDHLPRAAKALRSSAPSRHERAGRTARWWGRDALPPGRRPSDADRCMSTNAANNLLPEPRRHFQGPDAHRWVPTNTTREKLVIGRWLHLLRFPSDFIGSSLTVKLTGPRSQALWAWCAKVPKAPHTRLTLSATAAPVERVVRPQPMSSRRATNRLNGGRQFDAPTDGADAHCSGSLLSARSGMSGCRGCLLSCGCLPWLQPSLSRVVKDFTGIEVV
jgi:hypothetical protein